MDSASEVVAAVLQDFYEGENDLTVLAESCKVLSKIISNATKKSDLKYRRVNLQNTRIQTTVVAVPGALDILGLAGFAKVDGGSALVYTESPDQQMSQMICHNLEAKFEELKFLGAITDPVQAIKSNTMVSTPSVTPKEQPAWSQHETDNSPFLNNEERRRRHEAAISARKAREAERSRALLRWKEDKEDRKIKKAFQHSASVTFGLHEDKTHDLSNIRASLQCPAIQIKRLYSTAAEIVSVSPAQFQNHENLVPAMEAAVPASPAAKIAGEQDSASKVVQAEAEENMKPAAVTTRIGVEFDEQQRQEEVKLWDDYLKSTPRCTACQGICESSFFRSYGSGPSRGVRGPLRRLLKELDSMNESLPNEGQCTIFVRFDEEAPQYLRAIIPAALPGPTPYAGGLFLFDVYVPDDYPQIPPMVQLMNTGGGSVRFGPNLYADGKVCLSLLGTWPGPKWNPGGSTLNQVLISIQGLLLGVEHPYYLEPGHGGWEGKIQEGSFQKNGQTLAGDKVKEDFVPLHVSIYEDNIRIGTLQLAMLDMIRAISNKTNQSTPSSIAKFLQPFLRPIWLHFYHNRGKILKEVECWTRATTVATGDNRETEKRHLDGLRGEMSNLYAILARDLRNLEAPPREDPNFSGKKVAASTTAAMSPIS